MTGRNWDRVPIDAQDVAAPLSRAAVFLTLTVHPGDAALATMRGPLGGLDDLLRTVGFRDLGGRLSCIAAIGAELWQRLSPSRHPAEQRPFPPITGPAHTAPATSGDLLFHIRADRPDLAFEFEKLLLGALSGAATVADESQGFRHFDARDLLGFVGGTANPAGQDIPDAAGVEHDILRDTMPFGRPGGNEYGTSSIGYFRRLWVIEKRLERMHVGDPAGAYDRLLDFSRARTGATFFAPSRATLAELAAG